MNILLDLRVVLLKANELHCQENSRLLTESPFQISYYSYRCAFDRLGVCWLSFSRRANVYVWAYRLRHAAFARSSTWVLLPHFVLLRFILLVLILLSNFPTTRVTDCISVPRYRRLIRWDRRCHRRCTLIHHHYHYFPLLNLLLYWAGNTWTGR